MHCEKQRTIAPTVIGHFSLPPQLALQVQFLLMRQVFYESEPVHVDQWLF